VNYQDSNLALKEALQGGMRIFVQPIVDLEHVDDEAVMGWEVLYHAPKGFSGVGAKGIFSEAARQKKAYNLDLVCCQKGVRSLKRLGPDARAFFNLQPESFVAKLFEHQASPFKLLKRPPVIEVMESQRYRTKQLVEAARVWHEAGFLLAVDDVSTGYNRLLSVVDLKPDFIKLDRQLVADCHENQRRKVVISSINALANDLGAVVIAEGIETKEELECLQPLGIKYAQGFYFSRPMPVENMSKNIRKGMIELV